MSACKGSLFGVTKAEGSLQFGDQPRLGNFGMILIQTQASQSLRRSRQIDNIDGSNCHSGCDHCQQSMRSASAQFVKIGSLLLQACELILSSFLEVKNSILILFSAKLMTHRGMETTQSSSAQMRNRISFSGTRQAARTDPYEAHSIASIISRQFHPLEACYMMYSLLSVLFLFHFDFGIVRSDVCFWCSSIFQVL